MKPTWLFESGFNDDQAKGLADAARDAECVVHFSGDKDNPIAGLMGICGISYGSIGFLRGTFHRYPQLLHPSSWLNLDNLKCSTYLAYWSDFSIHTNFGFFPLGILARDAKHLFSLYESDGADCVRGKVFIRPDSGTKVFDGQLVDSPEEIKRILNMAVLVNGADNETMCLISWPTPIIREFRTVVVDSKVVAISQYWMEGKLAIEQPATNVAGDVIAFVEDEILASTEWRPDSVFVLDVADTRDGYELLELGSVNCSSLYACDPVAVVEACNRAAEREYAEMYD